jgi:L-ascorbate metabolism protein UlaG (beta-lactamase superfamily)
MELAHFGHSCVLVQTSSARLLFDPGTFSDGFEALTDLSAILLTHQHGDHLDLERLPALVAANPQATLVLDAGSVPAVAALGLSIAPQVARPGDRLELGGESVTVTGGEHAVIHPDIPVIPNVGYVIGEGAFYHPGDSLAVVPYDVDVLAAPVSAPWLRVSDAVDFVRALTPRVAVPIHEAVLAAPFVAVTMSLISQLAPDGTEVRSLPRAETVPV